MVRLMKLAALILVLVLVLGWTVAFAAGEDWPCYGRNMARESIAVDGPGIDAPSVAWVAPPPVPADANYIIEFDSSRGPVVYDNKVYIYAKYLQIIDEFARQHVNNVVIAFNAATGVPLWTSLVDISTVGGWILDSWSSPCFYPEENLVLIGSGKNVYALDADTGNKAWTTVLAKPVVNASVCLATDLPHPRAFITDYTDLFAGEIDGRIYCINLDANTPDNRYDPGEIVWSDIIGSSSGNTPAYRDGVVYVASLSEPNNPFSSGDPNEPGTIHAYNAYASDAVGKLWQSSDPNFEGFSGGLTVTKAGFLYAVNYDFYGDSAFCKIDCATGNIVWITQAERSSSTPIVVGNKIYISSGLEGFGSHPKLQAFEDLGNSVTKLWDANEIGGWSNQPAYANGKLYVGKLDFDEQTFISSYNNLYLVDVSYGPSDANFIVDHYTGCGSSPAVGLQSIYCLGSTGLYKFHTPALLADVSKNNRVDVLDLALMAQKWLYDGPIGVKRADLDLDGNVDLYDFALLNQQWHQEIP